MAAVKNRPEIIELLKDKGKQNQIESLNQIYKWNLTGSRFDLMNNDGKTAYDLALDPQCKALLQFEVDNEANRDYIADEEYNDSDS